MKEVTDERSNMTTSSETVVPVEMTNVNLICIIKHTINIVEIISENLTSFHQEAGGEQ